MRRFLIQSALFAIIALLCAVIFTSVVTWESKSAFKTEKDVTTLFLGNSHIECSINDSIVPNSFNFARSGERMEWVYSKMVLLLDANPQIERVVIGFDNVLCFNDAVNQDVHMGHFSPYFLKTLDLSDLYNIATKASGKYNYDMYTKALNVSKLYEIHRERGRGVYGMSMGGYVPSYRDKLKEAIQRHDQGLDKDNSRFDDLSHYFLDKTIQECHKRGIEVIFIFAPQHPLIQNEDTIYRSIYKKFYTDIPFWDYRSMSMPDSAFQDLDHLNYRGAIIFSKMLKEKMSANNNKESNERINYKSNHD